MREDPFCDDDDEETLVHLLDRVLDIGLVATGDLRISVAEVDLVYVGLKLVVASASRIDDEGAVARSFTPRIGRST
jgi:hypothetical protein